MMGPKARKAWTATIALAALIGMIGAYAISSF
jgi:hypothetical protein